MCCPGSLATRSLVNDDPLTNALDVIGQNEYIGRYEGDPKDADTTVWTFPDKPIIMSEFGAEAKYGNHGETNQRWTEEQQAFVIQHQFVMLRKIPNLRGVTPWILIDFRSTTRNIPKLQDGYNRKGFISEKGEKKRGLSYNADATYDSICPQCSYTVAWNRTLAEAEKEEMQHKIHNVRLGSGKTCRLSRTD